MLRKEAQEGKEIAIDYEALNRHQKKLYSNMAQVIITKMTINDATSNKIGSNACESRI